MVVATAQEVERSAASLTRFFKQIRRIRQIRQIRQISSSSFQRFSNSAFTPQMPSEFTNPDYVDNTGIFKKPNLRTLTGDTAFNPSMLGAIVDLAGFTLNLTSISGHGVFILNGPGAYTGLLSGVLAADEAHDFAVVAGDYRMTGGGSGGGGGTPASDAAYDATAWNGVAAPPTKNAVRDKFVSVDAAISGEATARAAADTAEANARATADTAEANARATAITAEANARAAAITAEAAARAAAFEQMEPLGLTAPPVDATVDGSLGTAQVETLTVTSGATTTETLSFEIRSNGGLLSSNYNVPVTAVDSTPALVAAKIRASLAMDTIFFAKWDLSGTGASVVITKRLPYAANDSLLRMRLSRFITTLNTSVDTTAGVLADGTHAKLGQTAIVTAGGTSTVYVCVNEAFPKWVLTTDTAASIRAKAAEAHALFRTAIHSVGSDATGIPGATQLNNVVVIPSADYNDIPVEDLDPQTAYILPDAEEIGTTAPLAGVAVGGGPLTDGASSVTFPVLPDLGDAAAINGVRAYGLGSVNGGYQYSLNRNPFNNVWQLTHVISAGVFRTWLGNSSGQATPDLVTSWTPTSPATGVPTIALTAATVAPPYIRVAGGFLYVPDAGFWKKAPLSALLANPSLPRVFTITADYTIVNSDSGSSISVTSFARITLPPSPGVPVSFTLKATAAVSFVCSSSYVVVSAAGILTRVTGGTETPFALSQDGGGVIPRIFSCAFIGDQWVITTIS